MSDSDWQEVTRRQTSSRHSMTMAFKFNLPEKKKEVKKEMGRRNAWRWWWEKQERKEYKQDSNQQGRRTRRLRPGLRRHKLGSNSNQLKKSSHPPIHENQLSPLQALGQKQVKWRNLYHGNPWQADSLPKATWQKWTVTLQRKRKQGKRKEKNTAGKEYEKPQRQT